MAAVRGVIFGVAGEVAFERAGDCLGLEDHADARGERGGKQAGDDGGVRAGENHGVGGAADGRQHFAGIALHEPAEIAARRAAFDGAREVRARLLHDGQLEAALADFEGIDAAVHSAPGGEDRPTVLLARCDLTFVYGRPREPLHSSEQ